MTNEVIGHYASHPGGGYQPPKSDKPKAQNPPGSGAHETPPPPSSGNPSDLELKIRKEVMARINKSLDIAMNGHCCDDIIEAMEDVRLMLNLLWGE